MTGPPPMDADIARRIESLSPAKRGLLDLLIARAGRDPEVNRLVRRQASYESVAPLSVVQEEWWLLDRVAPRTGVGNLQFQIRLAGPLDRAALTSALERIVRRHEILRTHVEFRAGQPRQVIAPPAPISLEFVDLRDRRDDERAGETARCMQQHANPPLEIAQPPLFRFALLRTGDEEHVLLLLVHHLVFDGWSMGVFLRQLAADYEAIVIGATSSGADLPIQYADFACWQRTGSSQLTAVRDLAYWKRQLAGVSRLRLPVARGTTARRGVFDIAYEHRELPPGLYDAVRRLAGDMVATPFAVLLAAFAIVLYGLTHQDDIVISAPHAKRDRPEVAGLIGSFAGYLILRTAVAPTDTFRTLVARVRGAVLDACAHGDAAFHRIVQAVQAANGAVGFNPTQAYFNLFSHDQMYPVVDAHGVQMRMADDGALGRVGFGFDIALQVYEWEQSVRASGAYDPGLFDVAFVRALLDSYVRVLEQCTQDPDATVSSIEAAPFAMAPGQSSASAARRRIAIASMFPTDGLENAIGFWSGELNHALDVVTAPPDQVFQQLLDPDSALSQNHDGLNVLLLRLDDWEPADVRKLIAAIRAFDRTAAPLLVCLCPQVKGAGSSSSAASSAHVEALIESELADIGGVAILRSATLVARNGSNEFVSARADAPASIPYSPLFISTLGTTIVRAMDVRDRAPYKVLVVDGDDTLWSGAVGEMGTEAIEIDAAYRAVQEFVVAQHDAGMLVCLCSRNDEGDIERAFEHHPEMPLQRRHLAGRRVNWRPKAENLVSLAEELRLGLESFVFVDDDPVACAEVAATCPEVLCVPLPRSPAARASFLQRVWAFDRWTVTAEDRMRTTGYRQSADRAQLREASITLADFLVSLRLTVDVTAAAACQTVRITQLLQRTRQFATSSQPRHESDLRREIETGSVEYFTAEASDRFGDYGLIGVIGLEADDPDTVRVETFALSCRALGRGIEHRMLAHVGAVAAARGRSHVDVMHRPTDRNRLVLDFLEGAGGTRLPDPAGVRFRFRATELAMLVYRPDGTRSGMESRSRHHVQDAKDEQRQAVLHRVAHLTRTAVDLNDPASVHTAIQDWRRRRAPAPAYVAPRTDLEERLVRLWADYLGLERVGIEDNFFDLGGHSMLAVQLMSKIARDFQVDLPLNALFGATTVSELAGVIEAVPAARTPHRSGSDHPRLVAIKRPGSNPPFFCVHGIDGSVLGYYGLARQFGSEQPFHALRSAGLDEAAESPVDRVEQMAASYADAIQSVHSYGPVFVGGWSFGAMVAFEVTRQLRERGIDVARLVLLDGIAPVAHEKRARFDDRAAPLVRLFGGLLALIGEDLGRLHEQIVQLPAARRWDRVLELAESETVGPLVSLLVGQQALSLVNVRSAYEEIARLPPDDRLRYAVEKLMQAQAVPAGTDVAYVERRLRVFKANLKAMLTYAPAGPLRGVPCRFFAAEDLLTEDLRSRVGDRCWGWQEFLTEPIDAETVGGNHYSMVMEPHAARLAERLGSWFERPIAGAEDAAAR